MKERAGVSKMKHALRLGILFVLLGIVGSFTFLFLSSKDDSKIYKEETLNIDVTDVLTLNINVIDQRILLTNSESDELVIKATYEEYETLSYQTLGSETTVKITAPLLDRITSGISLFDISAIFYQKAFVIELPSHIKTVNLKTSNGRIEVMNMNLDKANLTTSNGRIEVTDSTVSTLNIETSNGQINLTNVISNVAELDTSNGDINLNTININQLNGETSNGSIEGSKITSTDLDLETSNGSISLNINGSFTDYQVKTKTSNGKVRINDEFYGNSTYNKNQIPYIEVETSNGNIKLSFYGDE